MPSDFVDLVYLDPPFNSNRVYNVIYPDDLGQTTAFEDTWAWTPECDQYLADIETTTGELGELFPALVQGMGKTQLSAYLVNMAVRLIELRRVLKPTGSFYLHCDPTAGHYLKVVLDAIFGRENFRNEIIWRRTGSHNSLRTYGSIHDIVLFYSVSDDYTFNIHRRPYALEHVEKRYTADDTGRLKLITGGNILTGSGASKGDSGKPWRGFNPTVKNRHWAIPTAINDQLSPDEKVLGILERMEILYKRGLIEIKPEAAWPHPVKYLEEEDGQPYQDIWAYQPHTGGTLYGTNDGIDEDVMWLGPTSPERLGYSTQKPTGLLERIIRVSSNLGDLVLDPFCGCGTTIEAAENAGRNWTGIDITYASIAAIQERFRRKRIDTWDKIEIIGQPTTVAEVDNFLLNQASPLYARKEFEKFCVAMIGGMPNDKMGADGGIDGRIPLEDGKRAIVSVKSGDVGIAQLRELKGLLTKKQVAGVFVTRQPPTRPMVDFANQAGIVEIGKSEKGLFPPRTCPVLQIVTLGDILAGQPLNLPRPARKV